MSAPQTQKLLPETTAPYYPLRDQWYAAAVADLRDDFRAAGHPLRDTVRISCGWPTKGTRSSSKLRASVIGQCFNRRFTKDKVGQIFISPALESPVQVLETLVHELIHDAVGCAAGHGPKFREAALAMGLTGKMTATVAGDDLRARLAALADRLGTYPHAPLDPRGPKQTTRMLKVECAECQYIARVSRKMIDEHGCPICPTCMDQMTEGTRDEHRRH